MAFTTKYIFVTGGVLSSLGKGMASASIGALLESRGLRVTLQKLDPYINVDPGTMNPFQHGEVFVTDDGAETDLDLGHYERFTNPDMRKRTTSRPARSTTMSSPRSGAATYLGETVQVVPHITDEIKRRSSGSGTTSTWSSSRSAARSAISRACRSSRRSARCGRRRQGKLPLRAPDPCSLYQDLRRAKTKPTQHSVKELRAIGIQPDILLCRTDRADPTDVQGEDRPVLQRATDAVIEGASDVDPIYEVPLVLHGEGSTS